MRITHIQQLKLENSARVLLPMYFYVFFPFNHVWMPAAAEAMKKWDSGRAPIGRIWGQPPPQLWGPGYHPGPGIGNFF